MAKANVSLGGRNILDLESLSVDEINLVENTAVEMKKIMKRDIKKVPALRGKLIITLFYEPSTRTRTSFETAAKYLGADVINITTGNSSVVKGECLRDTILTLENMGCDGIIMRSPCEGAACYAAQVAKPVIINAGDGAHAHPSQGLLDLFTLREHGIKDLKGKKMVILGDVLFSRVARSNIACWKKFGADIHVAGPRTLMPRASPTMPAWKTPWKAPTSSTSCASSWNGRTAACSRPCANMQGNSVSTRPVINWRTPVRSYCTPAP